MQTYIAKRLLQAIPVIILVTFCVYALELLLPGDPIISLVASSTGQAVLDKQQIAGYRHEYGLDRPIPIQYALWLEHALHGNFGNSVKTHRPVFREIKARLPATLQLGMADFLISILVSFPAGIAAALWRNSPLDGLITALAVSAVAIPSFWFGIMLILLFSVKLQVLPPSGYVSVLSDPIEGLRLLILPAFILGWEGVGALTRFTRSAMLEVLGQDYIRTARAKGLATTRILWLHALKNGLPPVVTIIGLRIGFILAGAVIVETIFAIPGIGRLFVDSINTKDFPVVQALVLLIALCTIGASLLTDLAYAFLDPRIRFR
ncbi:MAG: ABC transporter permease [Dehalococcoidia bacterium]